MMKQEKTIITNPNLRLAEVAEFTDTKSNTTYRVENRTPINLVPVADIVVKNDNMSKRVSFRLPKYFDDINLFEKTIEIGFINANYEADRTIIDKSKYVTEEAEDIIIYWWLPSTLAAEAGTIQFQLRFYDLVQGTNSYAYMWQTKISSFKVEQSLEIGLEAYRNEYIQERIYENSNRYPVTWVTILDYDLPVNINNRTIERVPDDLVISGDTNSQALSFVMPRYRDNIDLSKKVITIKYVNAMGLSDRARAINLIIDNETIKFTWLINSRFTTESGMGMFSIEILGYNYPIEKPDPTDIREEDLEFFYVWQTKPARTEIKAGLYIDGAIPLPNPEWEAKWQIESDEKLERMETLNADALVSKNSAATSAGSALADKNEAALSATNAKTSETASKTSETHSKSNSDAALASANQAATFVNKAKSWAVGPSGTGDGTDINNAKYYAEKAQESVGNKGWFTNEAALIAAHPNNIATPSSRNGWFAIIGSTDSIWVWDADSNKWVDSGQGTNDYNALFNKPIINGKLLSGNVVLTPDDISALQVYPIRTISDGTDLNNVTNIGVYNVPLNTLAASLINSPTNLAFSLVVLPTSTKGVVQKIIEYVYTTPRKFFRTFNEGTWNPWAREYTTNDKPTPAEIGALTASGIAAGATKLATPRLINGTAFDGTEDITTSKWGHSTEIGIASQRKNIDGSLNSYIFNPMDMQLVRFSSEEYQNFNSYTENGHYGLVSDKEDNGFPDCSNGQMIVSANGTTKAQIGISTFSGKTYIRTQNDTNNWTDWNEVTYVSSIVNNLTSTSVTSPLAAAQGRILADRTQNLSSTTGMTKINGEIQRNASDGKFPCSYKGTTFAAPLDWKDGDIFLVYS